LGGLSWQNYHVPFEAILAEMGVKGKSMVESVMVNQIETGAIDKAEVFVSVPVKIALAVCSFASLTRSTLMPVCQIPS